MGSRPPDASGDPSLNEHHVRTAQIPGESYTCSRTRRAEAECARCNIMANSGTAVLTCAAETARCTLAGTRSPQLPRRAASGTAGGCKTASRWLSNTSPAALVASHPSLPTQRCETISALCYGVLRLNSSGDYRRWGRDRLMPQATPMISAIHNANDL